MTKTKTKTKTPSFDEVMSLARSWYYDEIRSLAEDAVERCNAHKFQTEDEAREWLQTDIDETTDGHEYVIYTAKAGMVCTASDNDGAYEESTGEPAPTVEAKACFAMRADIWQLLEARSDEWVPTEEEEE